MDTYMAGTEGTGEYVVIAQSAAGRLGVRQLEDDEFRVRFEPTINFRYSSGEQLMDSGDWKRPGEDGQERFSTVVDDEYLPETLEQVLDLMGDDIEYGKDFPDWVPVVGCMPKKKSACATTAPEKAALKKAIAGVEAALANLNKAL